MVIFDRIIDLIDSMIKRDRENLHTTALGKIVSFDPINMRAEVYLLENIRYENKFYESQTIVDCIVNFPKTSSFYVRIPYKAGDKVVVCFCESNIADISISGDRANQTISRRHSEDDLVVMGGWIAEQGDDRTMGGSDSDLVIVNTTHDSFIKFTEDNNIIVSNIQNINVQCESATVDATKTTINSETEINGITKINGNTSIVGALDVSQSVSTPNVSASTSLTVKGKEMDAHKHTTTKEGQPTSPPI